MKIDNLEDYKDVIRENLKNCLNATSAELKPIYSGKVRECFDLDTHYAIITTDRQSAFDRVLANVPFKGQVLNELSAWWFRKTSQILNNHLVEVPDPNISIVKKCKPFPVEFVVRGYLTGSSNTSIWTNYSKGVRNYCGISLSDGLIKNQKLEDVIITPTTKEDEGDVPISPIEIVSRGLMTQDQWEFCSEKAISLFKFGQIEAEKRGFILVDTKYEMGVSENGKILLIDEIHSPDSSRYWLKSSYISRFNEQKEPENIDKEFLRLWFKKNCDPYNDNKLPQAPEDLIVELSLRYIQLYEKITGKKFTFASIDSPANDRVNKVISSYLAN